LYIRNAVQCIDEANAVFDTYDTNDPVRPDLGGQIRTIYTLVLDKSKISSEGIFRLGGYPSMIIIREDLMLKMKELKTTGVKFKKVT